MTKPRQHRPHGRLTLDLVRKALIKAKGIPAYAAEALGVERSTIKRWIDKTPELQQLRDELRADVVDQAKTVVVDGLKSNDENVKHRSARYILDNWGQDEGFGVRRHEHTGPNGGPIPVQHDLSGLTVEELETLRALRLKINGQADTGASGRVR